MSPSATPQQTPHILPCPDAESRPKLKLLDRVSNVIRARHYSRRSEEADVHWIRRYIVFHLLVPVVLSRDEVSSVLKQLTGTIWVIVVLLYGAGLRIQDCLGLRVNDIDFDRHQIVLPFALDRKYPNASTEWAWQFVFPAARICCNPEWGPPSRFHLHESVIRPT